MGDIRERLLKDLDILVNMTAGMEEYLAGATLYGRGDHPEQPPVTLGGAVMRHQRLEALAGNLPDADAQQRLRQVSRRLDEIWAGQPQALARKAVQELAARLHLWQGHLQDMAEEGGESPAHYATSVETRVLLAALLRELDQRRLPPPRDISARLAELDRLLAEDFRPGSFVWAPSWQSAYPRGEYWWLYGLPGNVSPTG